MDEQEEEFLQPKSLERKFSKKTKQSAFSKQKHADLKKRIRKDQRD
jgi:hypothetical protein